MRKITPAQQTALDKLTSIGEPATSQKIGAQITTMQALEKAGRVKPVKQFGNEKNSGRECEAIHWQLN